MAGLVGSLLLAACGPPKASDGGESETGEEGPPAETTEQPDPPDPPDPPDQPDPEPPDPVTTGFVPVGDVVCNLGCDPFYQDCPDGEKCVAYASTGTHWDTNKCVPVAGNQAAGEPCSYAGLIDATDDCDEESACWDLQEVDGEWFGTCRSFCGGTPDDPQCGEGQGCLIANHGSIDFCLQTCDPLLQDCAEGTACVWSQAEFLCTSLIEAVDVGEPCAWYNGCDGGQLCVDTELLPNCLGAACCTRYCDLGQADVGCEALPGTTCTSFYEPDAVPPGFEHLGVCVVP